MAACLIEVGAHALPPVRDTGIVAGPELAAKRPQTDDTEDEVQTHHCARGRARQHCPLYVTRPAHRVSHDDRCWQARNTVAA